MGWRVKREHINAGASNGPAIRHAARRRG